MDTNFDILFHSLYQKCSRKTKAIDWNLILELDYSDICKKPLLIIIPQVLTTETINVESLAHHASSHKIFVFPKIAIDYR